MPRLVKEKESGLASLALQGPGVLLLLGGLAGAASSFVLNPLGPLRDWIISPLLGGLIAGVGLGLMLAGTLFVYSHRCSDCQTKAPTARAERCTGCREWFSDD